MFAVLANPKYHGNSINQGRSALDSASPSWTHLLLKSPSRFNWLNRPYQEGKD